MDPKERWEDPEEADRTLLDGKQADIWTALPVIFKSHDVKKHTVTAQATIKIARAKSDGTQDWLTIPELVDVPIHYPSGGGLTMTFPVKDGDEGLVVFASRCIDKWWRDGGVQEQTEYRMHDLSDGFAIPGFRSQKRTLDNVSTTAVQLRSDDGKKYVELDDKGKITLKSEDGQVVVTKDSVAISALSSVLLSGGGPAVARVGDATICAAGPGHITSGSRKTSSG